MGLGEWLTQNWPELAAALGLGAGSGLATKKLADKEQDKKIQTLQDRLDELDKRTNQLENDVVTNTMFDKQLRQQMEREYSAIQGEISEVKGRLEQILNHLLNMKK